MCYLPDKHQVAVSSSDAALSVYDGTLGSLWKSFRTPTVQTCLAWCEDYQTLFSADAGGLIRAWNLDHMEEKFLMGHVHERRPVSTRGVLAALGVRVAHEPVKVEPKPAPRFLCCPARGT